ncbi:telomere repeats-binding bouquet formation protein 2 [Megalops cyprinoides]|uniref:telomere repeats-binding bouquet formation protein 2 n=1 Tax=Megalops cyprinoides TaxID=118141 RepID=UPI0018649242|nr:telomere repeats-binding bouquet formation protein 2 [Megalops cyprinoides]
MFTNKKAWFSKSVNEDIRRLWVSEGGAIVCWRAAEYLFSNDASCCDTRRIFDSVDYVEDRATVFHSAYISTCEKTQSLESVLIGHYVLPPASVQKEVRSAVGRFIWEQGEAFKWTTHQREASPCCNVQQYPVNNMLRGYVCIDELRKYSGELHDFLPGHSGYSVSKVHI